MKQTNNAIKFLVAQYRAIFKNAYVKGIATALVVTAGLAAGQAQAATTISLTKTESRDTDITISAEKKDANFISNATTGTVAAVELNMPNNSILINAKDAGHGLTIKGNASEDGTLTVNAKSVSVDGGALVIGDAKSSGNATLNIAETLTIGSAAEDAVGSSLEFAAAAAVAGTVGTKDKTAVALNKSGKISAVASKDSGATGVINAKTFNMTEGAIVVSGGGAADKNADLKLNIGGGSISGGSITLAGKTGSGTSTVLFNVDKSGSLAITGTDVVSLGEASTLNISGGNVTAASTAFKKGAGALGVSGTLTTDIGIAKKAVVSVAKGGTLDLQGANVDLTAAAPEISFGTAKAGEVGVVEGSIIKLGDLTVGQTFDKSGSYFVNKLITKEASSLTNGNITVSSGTSLGGKYTVGKSGVVTLDGAGAIEGTGPVVLSEGTVNVASGAWDSQVDVEVGLKDTGGNKGGNLVVGSAAGTSDADKKVSSLTLSDNASFTLISGSVVVGGQNNSAATLDLSNAKAVSLKDALADTKLDIKTNGKLVLKGTDANQLTSSQQLKSTVEAGGSLYLVGDANFDAAKLISGQEAAGSIVTKGTIESDSTLTLSGTKLDIAGEVKANNLKFTNGTDKTFTLSGGKATAVSGLDVGAEGSLVISGAATTTLTLGVAGTSSAGNVTGKLDVQKSGAVAVAAGSWTAGDVSLNGAGAALNVAQGASLTSSNLTVTSGAANISGSATVDALTSTTTNGLVNVGGTLTINGIDAADKNNGITAGSGSIVLSKGGEVVITGKALELVKTDGSTTGFADGAFTSTAGATITLTYGADKTLALADLGKIRADLISGASAETSNANNGIINVGDAKIDGVTVDENGEIAWTDAKKAADYQSTNFDLTSATVTGAKSSDAVYGSFGAVKGDKAEDAQEQVSVGGDLILQNAAGNNGFFASNSTESAAKGLNVTAGITQLKNGGTVGKVTLGSNTSLMVDSASGKTVINGGIIGKSGDVTLAGATAVTGDVDVQKADIKSGVTTVSGKLATKDTLTVGNGATTEVTGALTAGGIATIDGSLKAASATFSKEANLNGDVTVTGILTAKDALNVAAGTTKAGTVKLSAKGADIQNGGTLIADALEAASTSTVFVGNDLGNTAPAGSVGTGYLQAERFDLNGASLVVDPAWGENASIAAIDKFGKVTDAVDTVTNGVSTNGGLLKGNVYALQNAVVGIGADLAETKAALTAAKVLVDGKLSNDASKVGAAVYVAKSVKVDATSKIVVDKSKNQDNYGSAANYTGDLYLGAGSALVVSDAAALHSTKAADGSQEAAVVFNKEKAVVHVEQGGTVVLAGSGYGVASNISLFRDNGNSGSSTDTSAGVRIDGSDLVVKSANGLFTYTLKADATNDSASDSFKLEADKAKIKKSFGDASTPAYETAVKYALGYGQLDNTFTGVPGTELKGQTISKAEFDALTKEEQAEFTIANKDGTYSQAYNNALLNAVVMDGTSAKDIDTLTRAGAFSGVAHATVAAGTSTAGAIGARFGLGSTPANVTAASNNMGGALFVAPIYASMDSDGFAAQGTNYGVDVDLYGAAIGADFEVAPGFRVGGVFNVGSGDTEGNGAAAGSKDDFKYYGFGLFAGYSVGAFSIVGDINYTMVDNDLELNFASIGKYSTSLDSTNLNVGVGAQYAMELGGLAVVPHAGVRYMRVEADDYSVTGVGSYAGSDVSVVAIPVGVTVAKAFVSDNFTVKPLFDLTLTSNLGDDELEGQFNWDGVNLETKVATEILDNFSYGATAGVAMETGNFAAAFGVNYTGSSNTDSFAVSASARYLF